MAISVGRDDDEINELVAMIDKLMENGGGHLTIDAEETNDGIHVKTYRTTDCGVKNSACCQPNEKSVDFEDDEI